MWQTIGHNWAVELLSNSLKRGRIAHSYLFTGPSGIGKAHLALELAAAINCRQPEVPCRSCKVCSGFFEGTHPDLTVIAPERSAIRIGQVREAQHGLALKPYQATNRVCIISDFEMATPEAANALLKTLEEPPSSAVIILTARDASLLLPTVVSRCQHIGLRLVPARDIEQALVERYQVSPDRASLLAQMSAGRVGWALEAAQDQAVVELREQRLRRLVDILHAMPADRIMAAEELAKASDLKDMLVLWREWWHQALVASAGRPDLSIDFDPSEMIDKDGTVVSPEVIGRSERYLEQAQEQLVQNVNPRLVIEVLLLRWPQLAG